MCQTPCLKLAMGNKEKRNKKNHNLKCVEVRTIPRPKYLFHNTGNKVNEIISIFFPRTCPNPKGLHILLTHNKQPNTSWKSIDKLPQFKAKHSLFFRCIQLRAFFKFYNREYIYFFLCTSIVTVLVIMKFQTLQ